MEENEQTIDLRVLLKVLKDRLLPIAASALIAAALGFMLSAVIIPKQYTVEARLFVENSVDNSSNSSININDINAAQKIVTTCQVLFTSDRVLGDLKSVFDDYTINELKDMIVIEAVDSTEILRIAVTTLDPQTSVDMVSKLVELSINEFERVIKNGSIIPIYPDAEHPLEAPLSPSFPSIPMFSVVGLFIGLVVSYIVFLIIEMIDIKVKPGDDLMQMYGIPVFAEIMDFELSDKSSYKYKYYSTSTPAASGSTPKPTAKGGSKSISPLSKNTVSANSSDAEKIGDKRKENA